MIDNRTYRRDRFGERWHIIPAGEHGPRGRSLCGEPRQGTRLSETHSDSEPRFPDAVCQRCTDAAASAAPIGA
jgi:hypothetical protein